MSSPKMFNASSNAPSNTIPDRMCGVLLTGHGDMDKLAYHTDLPVPSPLRQEVLIKVHAAAVNNTDINTRTGWYAKKRADDADWEEAGLKNASWAGDALSFPRIQGIDACGEIVAVGDAVNPARIGERVLVEPCLYEGEGETLTTPWFLGSECDGGFAEYLRVAAMHAHAIKSDLPSIELASFPCSYSTAENMLTRAEIKSGETILITGASGGVGSAALQLAKARGAYVIALTSPQKTDALKTIGADEVSNRQDNWGEKLGRDRFDSVIDLVGAPIWPEMLDCLKTHGRYAVAGAVGGAFTELDLRTLYLKDLSFFGCTALAPGVFARLIKRIEQGQIKPLIAETYELRDIKQAQTAFLRHQHIGKIVLNVGG